MPVYTLSIELDGPEGRYTVTTNRIIVEHEVALLMDKEVRVRVHPDDRFEAVIDEQL